MHRDSHDFELGAHTSPDTDRLEIDWGVVFEPCRAR